MLPDDPEIAKIDQGLAHAPTLGQATHHPKFFVAPCPIVEPRENQPALPSTAAGGDFDTAAEGFFHGLTLGFLAELRDEFRVLSNAESGEGRFDIALKPLVEPFPAFIIEVKHAKSETEDLKALAAAALRQIDDRDYAASFRAEGLADVEKIGLAYYKKKVEIQVGR